MASTMVTKIGAAALILLVCLSSVHSQADSDSFSYDECQSVKIGRMPYEDSCGEYVMCARGSAWLQTCPDGLVFDRVNNECDFTWNIPQCSRGKWEAIRY